MTCNFTVDCKFVFVVGISAVGIILARKVDPATADKVLVDLISTLKGKNHST